MEDSMIKLFVGIHKGLYQSVLNGTFVPMVTIPRVPATATTEEVPSKVKPKEHSQWNQQKIVKVELGHKAKHLLIILIPNEIFQFLDACEMDKESWE